MASQITRRAALAGTAAALLAPSTSWAKTSLPEVDQLSILFLVDGAVSSFAEPITKSNLTVERQVGTKGMVTDRNLAEWGLSLLLSSRVGKTRRNVLLDFGYSPEALLNNARLAGTDFRTVDAMVLSHGHYDHFGGLNGLLEAGLIRSGTPFLVGGEEALCHRQRGGPEFRTDFGQVDRSTLRKHGVALQISSSPRLVADHAIATGRIPLVFEHPLTPTVMEPGKNCDRALLDPDKRSLNSIQDDSRHELGLAYYVRERGLVVIGSCSHRGILNTIAAAQAVSGHQRLHAVVGGFHLVAPQTREDARNTATALAALAPDFIVPGHCSGEWFMEAALETMPGKVIRPYVGTRLTFGR